MNLYIRNACFWMGMATWFAFLAGLTQSAWQTAYALGVCAVAVLVVACNLEGLRHEGKAR